MLHGLILLWLAKLGLVGSEGGDGFGGTTLSWFAEVTLELAVECCADLGRENFRTLVERVFFHLFLVGSRLVVTV
jgi:hypothetical protein